MNAWEWGQGYMNFVNLLMFAGATFLIFCFFVALQFAVTKTYAKTITFFRRITLASLLACGTLVFLGIIVTSHLSSVGTLIEVLRVSASIAFAGALASGSLLALNQFFRVRPHKEAIKHFSNVGGTSLTASVVLGFLAILASESEMFSTLVGLSGFFLLVGLLSGISLVIVFCQKKIRRK